MANRITSFLMFILLSAGIFPAQIAKQLKQMASADSLSLTEIFKDLLQSPELGSEDFHYPVIHNKKAVYNFIVIGTANPELVAKAAQEGKKYPFFNHNGNYQVDLAAIPLGTVIGATALLKLFKK